MQEEEGADLVQVFTAKEAHCTLWGWCMLIMQLLEEKLERPWSS